MPVSVTTRGTDAIARVFDDNLNSWEHWAGVDLNVDIAYSGTTAGVSEFEQAYWAYRGQAAVCKRTTDSAIVRVRIGDGSSGDRTVYRQIITDPTDTSQWETWTQLYTGNHYAIAIVADASAGAGYRIYHAKSDGLYMDNVLVVTKANIIKIKPTFNDIHLVYYQTVGQDLDGARVVKWWFTPDITAGPAVEYEDCANFRWYRSDVVAVKRSDNYYWRFRAMAFDQASRHTMASQTLTCDGLTPGTFSDSTGYPFNDWGNVRYLKGPSARAGYKVIDNLYVTQMYASPWSTAYYLFYNERHFGPDGSILSNLKNPLFWSRAVTYPYYLSEPVPVGYSIWGFAGVIEKGDYVYLCGNGRVLRRPRYETVIDLTNYIPEGDYELPRDNQKGTGKLICANPNNIVGAQLGMTDSDEASLTDHRLDLKIGQVGQDGVWTYKEEASWWVSRLRKIKSENKEQVEVQIADFYHRMENEFRDFIHLPGNLSLEDWSPAGMNQLQNYFNDTDEFQSYNPDGADPNYVPRLKTLVSGDGPYGGSITLYGNPIGENGYVAAVLWQAGGLVFRYQDAQNFYLAKFTPGQKVELIRYEEGVPTTLATAVTSAGLAQWLIVDFRWKRIKVTLGSTLLITHSMSDPVLFSGWVGTTCPEVSNIVIRQHNAPMTTKELLRVLLAYVDEHNAVLELDEDTAAAEQLDLNWGPQTGLETPDKAFRQIIEAGRLQTVWKPD